MSNSSQYPAPNRPLTFFQGCAGVVCAAVWVLVVVAGVEVREEVPVVDVAGLVVGGDVEEVVRGAEVVVARVVVGVTLLLAEVVSEAEEEVLGVASEVVGEERDEVEVGIAEEVVTMGAEVDVEVDGRGEEVLELSLLLLLVRVLVVTLVGRRDVVGFREPEADDEVVIECDEDETLVEENAVVLPKVLEDELRTVVALVEVCARLFDAVDLVVGTTVIDIAELVVGAIDAEVVDVPANEEEDRILDTVLEVETWVVEGKLEDNVMPEIVVRLDVPAPLLVVLTLVDGIVWLVEIVLDWVVEVRAVVVIGMVEELDMLDTVETVDVLVATERVEELP